jgi:hypothetical protein
MPSDQQNNEKRFQDFKSWIDEQTGESEGTRSSGRLIKKNAEQIETASAHVPDLSNKTENRGEAKRETEVVYLKKDGVITGVKIKCTCGEVIHLTFSYDPPIE